MEHENVKDALKAAIEIAEAKGIKVDGKPATAEDIQEMVRELLYNVANLLGMSEVYLGKYPMPYTLEQELLIYYLAKKNVRALHDELNDKKIKLSDRQRDLLLRELQRYQELLYTNRLNRQINI
nr:MAG TPA: hypothetical protein [Caudoviricetes sp.]